MAEAAAAAAHVQIAAQQLQIDALIAAAAAAGPPPSAQDVHNAAMLALTRKAAAGTPPSFAGSLGLDAHRWLTAVDLFFVAAGVGANDPERLILAGRALTGPALAWFEFERKRPMADPALITTWVQFTAALRKRFEPVDVALWSRNSLTALTSKGMTNVNSYCEKFQEIISLIPDMAEPDRVFYFKSGLPQHLKAILANKADVLLSLQSNIEAAMRAEGARSLVGSAAAPSGSEPSRWQPRSSNRPSTLHQMEQSGDEEEPSHSPPSGMMSLLMSMQSSINALQAQQAQRGRGGKNGGGQRSGKPPAHHTPGLSDELAHARIAARLCIKCGSADHMKAECKNAADLTTQPKTQGK
jgi:hypothetical protein